MQKNHLFTERSSIKAKTFVLNTFQPDICQVKMKSEKNIQTPSKSTGAKPYMMIQPKVFQELDENNKPHLRVQFENSISEFQISQGLSKSFIHQIRSPKSTIQRKQRTTIKSSRDLSQL
ncbi:hypothetical protein pb186bvf_016162 [Paramecium bursaria]